MSTSMSTSTSIADGGCTVWGEDGPPVNDSPMARSIEWEQMQDRLREAAELRDAGLITEGEFEELKRKLLDRIR
jgi:Short C-terminal domain